VKENNVVGSINEIKINLFLDFSFDKLTGFNCHYNFWGYLLFVFWSSVPRMEKQYQTVYLNNIYYIVKIRIFSSRNHMLLKIYICKV